MCRFVWSRAPDGHECMRTCTPLSLLIRVHYCLWAGLSRSSATFHLSDLARRLCFYLGCLCLGVCVLRSRCHVDVDGPCMVRRTLRVLLYVPSRLAWRQNRTLACCRLPDCVAAPCVLNVWVSAGAICTLACFASAWPRLGQARGHAWLHSLRRRVVWLCSALVPSLFRCGRK